MLRKKYLLPAKNFYSYRNDLIQQQTDIEKLLTEQNIPEDLEEYDIETFGPIIQVDKLFIIKYINITRNIMTDSIQEFSKFLHFLTCVYINLFGKAQTLKNTKCQYVFFIGKNRNILMR